MAYESDGAPYEGGYQHSNARQNRRHLQRRQLAGWGLRPH